MANRPQQILDVGPDDTLRQTADSSAADEAKELRAEASDVKLPPVSRLEFRDFLVTERNHARNCCTLPLTTLLWLTVLLAIFNHGRITSVGRLRRCVFRTITDTQTSQPVLNSTESPAGTLANVSSVEGVWTWIAHGFLPAMGGSANHPGCVCTFNQVVGQIQLKQLRRASRDCQVDDRLATYYRGLCRSDVTSQRSFGGAGTDLAFVAGGGMADHMSLESRKSFFAWLNPRRLSEAQARAAQLSSQKWCDDWTEELTLRVALFNAEVHAFTLLSVLFTFESGGAVHSVVTVTPFFGNVHGTTWAVFIDVLSLILCATFLFLAVQEALDRKGLGFWERWFGSVWMVVDWLTIASCLAVVICNLVFMEHLAQAEAMVVSAARGAKTVAQATQTSGNATGPVMRELELIGILEELEFLVGYKINLRLALFWCVMLLLCRFFRGFTGQPRIYVIGLTVERALPDVLHLFLVLLALFVNFALGGCVLFGAELADWASVSLAHRSALAIMFGQGNFAVMYAVAPVSATIWLVLFLVSIVFLVSNMVVAMLYSHYRESKQLAGLATTSIWEQSRINFKEFLWRASYHYRTVHRFFIGRLNTSMQRYVREIPTESQRISRVPYDELLEAVAEGMEEAVAKEMETTDAVCIEPEQPFPWNVMSVELLLSCGCDIATAEHLLAKCAKSVRGRSQCPSGEQLFFEFQNRMHSSYAQIDSTGEELHNWLGDRVVDLANIEPRQKQLAALSETIQPMQIWEGHEEFPALALHSTSGSPLGGEELRQVGDRLLELGGECLLESEPQDAILLAEPTV